MLWNSFTVFEEHCNIPELHLGRVLEAKAAEDYPVFGSSRFN